MCHGNDRLTRVKQIMFGMNQGSLVEKVAVPDAAAALAKSGDFDISISKFGAGEDGRDPRVVRFGVTQNCITNATDEPILDQYQGLEDRHGQFVEVRRGFAFATLYVVL
jgi:hypothetical protein